MKYLLFRDYEQVEMFEELPQDQIKKMIGKVNPANKPINLNGQFFTKYRGRNNGEYILRQVRTSD